MARTGAGRFDQLVTFEAPTHTPDGYGGIASTSWAEHARAWARVQPVSAREDERQGGLRASSMYLIDVSPDGLDGLTAEMRVRWMATAYNDLTLNIREIRWPDSRTMAMVIMAESGVAV